MEQKNRIMYLILSFLPILLYAINPLIALVAVVLIFGFAMFVVKDEKTYKDMLHPLVLVLMACVAFFALNFAFSVIHGFGNMWTFYSISGFKLFLDKFLIMFNTLLLLCLIGGVALILLGMKNNKKVVVLSDLVEAVTTGTCPFRKKTSAKKEQSKKKDEEPEVVVETEDDK